MSVNNRGLTADTADVHAKTNQYFPEMAILAPPLHTNAHTRMSPGFPIQYSLEIKKSR